MLNVLLYPIYVTLSLVQSVAVTILHSSLYIILQLIIIIRNLNIFRTLIQSTMVFKLISHVVGIVRNVLSKNVTRSRATVFYSDDYPQLVKEKIQWKSRALLIRVHKKIDPVHLQTRLKLEVEKHEKSLILLADRTAQLEAFSQQNDLFRKCLIAKDTELEQTKTNVNYAVTGLREMSITMMKFIEEDKMRRSQYRVQMLWLLLQLSRVSDEREMLRHTVTDLENELDECHTASDELVRRISDLETTLAETIKDRKKLKTLISHERNKMSTILADYVDQAMQLRMDMEQARTECIDTTKHYETDQRRIRHTSSSSRMIGERFTTGDDHDSDSEDMYLSGMTNIRHELGTSNVSSRNVSFLGWSTDNFILGSTICSEAEMNKRVRVLESLEIAREKENRRETVDKVWNEDEVM